MKFSTKFAIVVAEELEVWQKLNVVTFLTSGVIGETSNIIGEAYEDASSISYLALCVQPAVILKSSRSPLSTFPNRANNRGIKAAVYIQDMFQTGHDAANRLSVLQYETAALPLVGIAIRADKKEVDKIFKGAKLHD